MLLGVPPASSGDASPGCRGSRGAAAVKLASPSFGKSLTAPDTPVVESPFKKTGAKAPGSGGAEGIRTPDLLNAIEARSQLRHGPKQRIIYPRP